MPEQPPIYGPDGTPLVTLGSTNGQRRERTSAVDEYVDRHNDATKSPYKGISGAPPNLGRFPIDHVQTFQGMFGSHTRVYLPSDEALKHSRDNAKYMRNDVGIMECLEARQRGVALLDWQIVPEDESSQDQKALCETLEKLLQRIVRFTEYRMNLLHAIWYGRYGIAHRWGWRNISGRQYVLPAPKREDPGWKPIEGDKLVFRYDDGLINKATQKNKSLAFPDQLGIRVGARHMAQHKIGYRWTVEPSGQGLAYFLTDWERELVAVHKHMIEDAPWHLPRDANSIHGVGIRSRIYWVWFQKSEILSFLMSYLERSAGGIEIWSYPAGDPRAKEAVEEAAKERLADGRNVVLFPKPLGEEGMAYDVQVVEPGLAGIDTMQSLLNDYFGHLIKRYILGQTLTSEADATGLGSGLAELHLDTFLQIVKYDATNLEETITRELLQRIKDYNFPDARGIDVRFVINTESPNVAEKLQGFQTAWEMGCELKERDVMELVGAAIPTEEDKTLKNPQLEQQGMMPGMDMEGGAPVDQMAKFAGQSREDLIAAAKERVTNKLLGANSVEYVKENGQWAQRNLPDFDTGDRRRAVA